MLGFFLRLMGYEIPEGPIVFVDSTQNVLPCSVYDCEVVSNLRNENSWESCLERRVNVSRNVDIDSDVGSGDYIYSEKIGNCVLSQSV